MQRSNWFCEAYLRRAAVAHDRLKSTAVGSRDGACRQLELLRAILGSPE
jgi:hypothetical protein